MHPKWRPETLWGVALWIPTRPLSSVLHDQWRPLPPWVPVSVVTSNLRSTGPPCGHTPAQVKVFGGVLEGVKMGALIKKYRILSGFVEDKRITLLFFRKFTAYYLLHFITMFYDVILYTHATYLSYTAYWWVLQPQPSSNQLWRWNSCTCLARCLNIACVLCFLPQPGPRWRFSKVSSNSWHRVL